jgi:hypothetical protein
MRPPAAAAPVGTEAAAPAPTLLDEPDDIVATFARDNTDAPSVV